MRRRICIALLLGVEKCLPGKHFQPVPGTGSATRSTSIFECSVFDGQTRRLIQASWPMRRHICIAFWLDVEKVFAGQTLSCGARHGQTGWISRHH